MDIGIIFEMVGQLFLKICSIQFVIFGYTVSFGSVFVFAGFISIVIGFIHHLED